jgi:hypothetical protein
MEARQTARKAQEVEEVYTFDLQRKASGCYRFEQILDDATTRETIQSQKSEPILQMEEEFIARQNEELAAIEAFESDTKVDQQYAPGNTFDTIAEIQGFELEKKLYGLKQLPAGSPDAFDNDLTDLTEHHLEEELSQNKKAVTPWKDKVRTSLIHQEDQPPTQEDASITERSDEQIQELPEEQIQESRNEVLNAERKNIKPPNSALYFRPVNPKEK